MVKNLPNNLNANFWKWFADSKVVNADGTPRVMYHGTSADFDTFDTSKIVVVDTDAPFNGFWFSSDSDTSPAFHNPSNIMPLYLRITNPAPWQVWRKVTREVMEEYHETRTIPDRSRSTNDEVRHRLSDMGYDGILFNGKPDIDAEELERTGRVDFRSVRGNKSWLQKDKRPEQEWGEYTYQHTQPEAELVKPDGTRQPIKTNMETIMVMLGPDLDEGNKIDASKFDFGSLVGELVLSNGNKIISKMVTTDRTTSGLKYTGREVDEIGYYTPDIGHVTSYSDLADFIDSHDTVWVCFHPNQIKSIYNKGTWDSGNPKITEGLRGWIDIISGDS